MSNNNKEFLNEYSNEEYSKDFELLDIEFVCNRFNLKSAKAVGGKLYIVSQRDEWYVDNSEGYIVLHHKNKRNITRRYHREDRGFSNIFAVLSYIKRHDELIFKESHVNRRLDKLFDKISE